MGTRLASIPYMSNDVRDIDSLRIYNQLRPFLYVSPLEGIGRAGTARILVRSGGDGAKPYTCYHGAVDAAAIDPAFDNLTMLDIEGLAHAIDRVETERRARDAAHAAFERLEQTLREVSEVLMGTDLLTLAVRATAALGSPAAALAWLDAPNASLGGLTPRAIVAQDGGPERLGRVLERLQEGIFS
jgi:uncharacterized protein (DUF2384 family)